MTEGNALGTNSHRATERLQWFDAEKVKPPSDDIVLLLTRQARPFSSRTWATGWWDGTEWMFGSEGVQFNVVLYWAVPEGPADE